MHYLQNLFLQSFAFALFFLGSPAAAQQSTPYETISIGQGLSQGMVFDILQDRDGFIWVATKNGLNRYDGYNFTVFTNDPYDPHTLSSNTIVKLFEDTKGRIWVGTQDAGLNVYDKAGGLFYRLVNDPSDPRSLSGNSVRLIEETAGGQIVVACDGAGFNLINAAKASFQNKFSPPITRMTLPNGSQVYGMGNDKKGQFYMGGMDGAVYRFHEPQNRFSTVPNGQLLNNGYFTEDSSILINSDLFLSDGQFVFPLFDTRQRPPGNILFRPREALWEFHHRELYFYDVSKWRPGKTVKWTEQLPAATRLIYPFMIDRSGILWSGSLGYGLRKYRTTARKFSVPLSAYSVRWIVPGVANDVFLGDYAYGWRRLAPTLLEKNPFEKISHITQIDNFIIAKTGDYWLKSDTKGFLRYTPATGQLVPYPGNDYTTRGNKQPMLEDSRGTIWYPALGGKFMLVQPTTGKVDSISINSDPARPVPPRANCTALYQDGSGAVWIGTEGGLAKVVFGTGGYNAPEVTWFYNSTTDRNSLNYNHVSCFMDDPLAPDQYLWICTKGGGLNRLDKSTGNFFHITAKNGLPDDVVYGILADGNGNIWGSTNRGIFCLLRNEKGYYVRNFTKEDGLQDDEFNTGAFARLPNGQLAFGGVNGLTVFNPAEVLATGFTPKVFITSILVNNVPLSPQDSTGILVRNVEQTDKITLNYLQDILTLEFSALDYTAPNRNRYRYQMVGMDDDWVESGVRRSATYLHLPAGTYTFRLQGSNSQGTWSPHIAQLQITVLPPWWFSWWAYIIYGGLVFLGVRRYLRFSINRARLRSQLQFEQQEAKRIKELDVLKSNFYTNITHEFRTPLTVILGMAAQVAAKPSAYLTSGTELIIRNGERLLTLINEILDLAKLDSGKMTLNEEPGELVSFLRYLVTSFQTLADVHRQHLHFICEVDELQLLYDGEKIQQVLYNLLSNAIKFTPEKGHIYITVKSKPPETDGLPAWISILVQDTGPGISPDQLPSIFDRFYQADNSITRKAEGTGIGLALTKELVTVMGGSIQVQCPPNGSETGCEFYVTLPLKINQGQNRSNSRPAHVGKVTITQAAMWPPALASDNNSADDGNALILLVEDNADVVSYISSCLSDYRIVVGKNGKEGLEKAIDLVPDLIITDVMMPLVDGFELCRHLKSHEVTNHIPVIMLTARADRESKMTGLAGGADVYLEKPFHPEELLLRIQKLLELRRKLQQHYQKETGLVTGTTPEKEVFAQISQKQEEEKEDEFVKKIRATVEQQLGENDFTVEALSKQLFMSHSQLHRKLEALTGLSPNQFIRTIRLQKARERLSNSADSIGSIAQECGYKDPAYFARIFKQEHGLTPVEWRAAHKPVR